MNEDPGQFLERCLLDTSIVSVSEQDEGISVLSGREFTRELEAYTLATKSLALIDVIEILQTCIDSVDDINFESSEETRAAVRGSILGIKLGIQDAQIELMRKIRDGDF